MENEFPDDQLHTPEKQSSSGASEETATPLEDALSDDDQDIVSDELTTAEFRKKHPDLTTAPAANMVQRKRLERGHKYFDSGDYNMARAKSKKEGVPIGPKLLDALNATGEDHPTPENIPHKKYPPAPGISRLAS
ncbi:cAMP-regulated phosphoprotein 19-like [Paramacrobiotus metropolitanus]|uniref:cAMP-regulated phosphoprotein 19-like n=1 Tax=Paramacrobiotus metropolitanus TaxID=2943436 RepID=UPI002445E8D7|nr:cAMP-regulated phosphoprotein 19-like [Paramacrobiotus metropolitanus]